MDMDVIPAPYIIGATGMDAILQNIRVIILTMAYSVPLDRDFAHTGAFIDSPLPHVTARLIAEMVDAIESQEPRVAVDSIELIHAESGQGSEAMQGRLRPRIRFHLKKGVVL